MNHENAYAVKWKKMLDPDLTWNHSWEDYSRSMALEYRQSTEEGLDIEKYKELFDAVSHLEKGDVQRELSEVLFRLVLNTEQKEDYAYNEPSDLEGIRALRALHPCEKKALDDKILADKIKGAWYGRICGCFLGKPIECIHTDELHPILKGSGNFPMHRYILSTDITEETIEKTKFWLRGKCWADTVDCMPWDDDTNYTVLAQLLIDRCGRDFTPWDVSQIWLNLQPRDAYCTAERVAFCNFLKGFRPPMSAVYKNVYREWIGAQIRGDYFGYINPGNPEMAAEMAWRDASISHVKNGIYGEMFVAAMIACAATTDSIEDILLGGLGQIPKTSRLYAEITEILNGYKSGVSQSDCFVKIHEKYNEHDVHHWCHTISNACIVAAALLYGEGDYGKSICMAVETGFDTDCNGATVGSILGMRNGSGAIGKEWTDPICDTLETPIFGVGKVKISTLVEKTMKHIEK